MSKENNFNKSGTFLLSTGHFINDMYAGFLAPLLPLLMLKYNLSIALAAALATLLSVMTSLIQPLQGYFSDKLSRPYFAAFGPLVTAIFISMIGLAPTYFWLVVLLVIGGIGTSSFHPQAAALVTQTSGDRHGLGMSIFVAAGSLGVALGPVVILGVIKLWGLSYSIVTVVPGIIISFLLLRYAPNNKSLRRPESMENDIPAKVPRRLVILIGLLSAFTVFRATTFSGFNNLAPILLTRQGYSQEMAALLVTVFQASSALGSFVGGTISDWVGRKRILFLSHFLATPLALGFLYFGGILKYLCLAGMAFSLFTSLPVTIVMAQEMLPSRSGTASSLMMGFCWGIAGLLLTPLGALADSIGLEPVFRGMSLIPLFSLLFLIPVPKTIHQT